MNDSCLHLIPGLNTIPILSKHHSWTIGGDVLVSRGITTAFSFIRVSILDPTGWGVNTWRETMPGISTDVQLPAPILDSSTESLFLSTRFVDFSRSGSFTAGLTADGDVWAWGSYAGSSKTATAHTLQDLSGRRVTAVSAGAQHLLFLVEDGDVYCKGPQPYCDATDTGATPVLKLSNVTQIVAGQECSFAMKADGTWWTWGQGSYGMLGLGGTIATSSPTQIPGLPPYCRMTAGFSFSFCVSEAGDQVHAWGKNDNGQLGDGTLTNRVSPVLLSFPWNVSQIVSGDETTFALAHNQPPGSYYVWGLNKGGGTFGDASAEEQVTSPRLVQPYTLVGKAILQIGSSHALTEENELFTWGNEYARGQLGRTVAGDSNKRPYRVNVDPESFNVLIGDQNSRYIWMDETGLCQMMM